MSKLKYTTEEIIQKFKGVHGDRYDYSLVEYTGMGSKIKIICKKHGLFEQRANKHLSGQGCSSCGGSKKLTTEEVIKRFKKLHGDKYNYDLVDYKSDKIPVKIKCFIHGVFEQTQYYHLKGGQCPKCSGYNLTEIEKLKALIKKHNNKYDYSKTNFNIKNKKEKISIICKKHGVFYQSYKNHLRGDGCPICKGGIAYDLDKFLQKAYKIHGGKYDYSLVVYINSTTKISIICEKHGVFEQIPGNHLNGMGCPLCRESKGEQKISFILNDLNIKYIREYRFKDCKYKKVLPFDFYLPEYNLCIEYQGEQHYEIMRYDGDNKKRLELIKIKDQIRRDYCKVNNINYLEIPYTCFSNLKNIILKNI